MYIDVYGLNTVYTNVRACSNVYVYIYIHTSSGAPHHIYVHNNLQWSVYWHAEQWPNHDWPISEDLGSILTLTRTATGIKTHNYPPLMRHRSLRTVGRAFQLLQTFTMPHLHPPLFAASDISFNIVVGEKASPHARLRLHWWPRQFVR